MSERDVRIVAIPNGFVFVGEYAERKDSVILSSAHCIRRWGTTKGLGELVNGPTTDTILDAAGFVEVPKIQVLFSIVCSPSWPI
jgi:hypothetical protein